MNVAPPRIAITGVGMVTGLGLNAPSTLRRLWNGETAIEPAATTMHRCAREPCVAEVDAVQTMGESVLGDGAPPITRGNRLALRAAREALDQAELLAEQPIELTLGTSTGATREGIEDAAASGDGDTAVLVSRFLREPIGASGHCLAAELGQVTRATVVCSACSSGALAIAVGVMRLEQGAVLPQLVGGADSLNLLTLSGFESLGALSQVSCRPFDSRHGGLSLGEGAGFLLLESEHMVAQRGGRVLAWLSGYAVGAEAHHLTHPEPDGRRAAALMQEAMRRADVEPRDVGYVNAHGTATVANDEMESRAIRLAFGVENAQPYVSSSKGQIGHTLAAAGAIEAVITALAVAEQRVPPTCGLATPAQGCELRHVVGSAPSVELKTALSNSFGFGGACAVLAFQRDEPRAENAGSTHPMATGVSVSSLEPEPLVVSGLATLSPAGILLGHANADWLANQQGSHRAELPFEPLDRLVMERSRRFDRLTALTTLGCIEALADAGWSGDAAETTGSSTNLSVGLALGNSAGPVGRSTEFIRRILRRGHRGANPAEFPNLLPSALSGNASIYAGLRGPVFTVSDVGPTIQSALELGVLCLHARLARAMLIGSTECRDAVVVRAAQEGADVGEYPVLANDASSFLLIEGRSTARAHEKGSMCEVAFAGWVPKLLVDGRRLSPPSPKSLVLCGTVAGEPECTALQALGWARVPMRLQPPQAFDGWAHPACLLTVGAALVKNGQHPSVLVLTQSPMGLHVVLFCAGQIA